MGDGGDITGKLVSAQEGKAMTDCECQACLQGYVCECCQRVVDRVRGSLWGHKATCTECFSQWYDPDNSTFDHLNPVSVGNYVRSKHGLPPLAAQSA